MFYLTAHTVCFEFLNKSMFKKNDRIKVAQDSISLFFTTTIITSVPVFKYRNV